VRDLSLHAAGRAKFSSCWISLVMRSVWAMMMVELLGPRLIVAPFHHQVLRRAGDDVERGADLVRDARRQLAHDRQASPPVELPGPATRDPSHPRRRAAAPSMTPVARPHRAAAEVQDDAPAVAGLVLEIPQQERRLRAGQPAVHADRSPSSSRAGNASKRFRPRTSDSETPTGRSWRGSTCEYDRRHPVR